MVVGIKVVWTKVAPPKDGKYELVMPIGLPNEGTFDFLDCGFYPKAKSARLPCSATFAFGPLRRRQENRVELRLASALANHVACYSWSGVGM